jgi:hypothetical protein
MADKGRLSVEQCIKTVLFFTETRSVVVTQRRFRANFQTRWAPSFKTTHKLYNQFNNDGSALEKNVAALHLCDHRRTLTLSESSEWRCKEAPVNQQGRQQQS